MDNRTIRRETDADITGIHALITSVFAGVDPTDPAYPGTLSWAGREAAIVEKLRDDDSLSLSLVAVQGLDILGHIAASPVRITDGTGGWFGIGPVSVAPAHRGSGLGTALLSHAVNALQEGGAGGVVAIGNPEFYTRFDFTAVPELSLPGAVSEHFLARRLRDSHFPQGAVAYHPAFA